jgi:GntR family transcriptional regulator
MGAYLKAKRKIVKYIKKNAFKAGDKLPTEPELCELLELSRLTLREAIRVLKSEGIIYSVQGRGTFLTCSLDQIADTLNNNVSITEMIESSGYTPGVARFEKKIVKADKCIAERLLLSEGVDVLVCRRVRTADGKPVVYSMDYFAPRLSADFLAITQEEISLYEYVEKSKGIEIGVARAEVVAIAADEKIAGYLEIDIGTPIIVIKQVLNDVQGNPLMYAREYMKPNSFKLIINRRREKF